MSAYTNPVRRHRRVTLTAVGALFVVAQAVGTTGPASAQDADDPGDLTTTLYQTGPLPFTLDEVIGDPTGATEGSAGNVVIGDDEGENLDGRIWNDKTQSYLYPIDSLFTSDVLDFYGAIVPEARDGLPEEGWVGEVTTDIPGIGVLTGLQFSDVETEQLKSGSPLGTWAAGLGGSSVKASTEHFTVMEGVLTCHQTYPYDFWADEQEYLDGLAPVPERTAAKLAEFALECEPLTDPTDLDTLDGTDFTVTTIDDWQLLTANEDSVIEDILVDPDKNYSVTKKDDGKLLFRWGSMVKKPTDIRFQKTIALPEDWLAVEEGELGYAVTRAELVVRHRVTNNPNDQIRPEDWENEAATGLLPGYTESGGYWYSDTTCYEGDGDFIPAGTTLKYPDGALPNVPAADLQEGFTGAWYTTIDRDPFQWSYAAGGSKQPTDTLGELVSGPRWRMTSNKFGQDLPGLEIPAVDCAQPPYQKGAIRYETGEFAVTTINLLDWSADEPAWDPEVGAVSPFAYSSGWTHDWASEAVEEMNAGIIDPSRRNEAYSVPGRSVTSLGTTLTENFDVTFYVKGDQKPLEVYDVELIVEYVDDDAPPPTPIYDFGDLPQEYGSAFALADPTLTLGATVDAELEQPYSDDATGDDTTGVDDEDGVAFDVVGDLAAANVTVNGAGYLTAWVDNDLDGTFTDADEIVRDLYVETGTTRITFPAPTELNVAARFRIDASADDIVGSGEVEDYRLAIMEGLIDGPAIELIAADEIVDARLAEGTTRISLAAAEAVPWYATDVAVKIMATDADSPGAITVDACDATGVVPDLLYRPGTATYTTAIAPVDQGEICLDVSKETVEVTIEVIGFTAADGTFDSVTPTVVLDQTVPPGQTTIDMPDTTANAVLVAVSTDKAKGRGEVSFFATGDEANRYDVVMTVPGRQQTNLAVLPGGVDLVVDTEVANDLTVEVRGEFTGLVLQPLPLDGFDRSVGVGSPVTYLPAGSGAAYLNVGVVNADADGVVTLSHPDSMLGNLAFDKKEATTGFAIVTADAETTVSTTARVDLTIDQYASTMP